MDDSVDPLDAFMMGVNEEVKKINQSDRKRSKGNEAPPAMEVDAEGQQEVSCHFKTFISGKLGMVA